MDNLHHNNRDMRGAPGRLPFLLHNGDISPAACYKWASCLRIWRCSCWRWRPRRPGRPAAAAASALRRDVAGRLIERPPDIDLGEERGSLAGIYPVQDGATPYAATRLPAGLAVMLTAGLVAGMAGASGGFIKTPATTEIMKVPVKVAASTTTFTVGITSAAALIVFAIHGRINLDHAAPVIVGSLVGGQIGARLQARFAPAAVRAALGVVLVVVAGILFVR